MTPLAARTRSRALLTLGCLVVLGCSCERTATAPPPMEPDPITDAWFDHPREGMSVFVSGHSLIDQVFGPGVEDSGPIAEIARGAGRDHSSVLQTGPGSTAWRRHDDMTEGEYPVPDWERFDTLLVLERSDLALTIKFENTFREVGWFVDQIRDAAPGADELFFYQTWWGFDEGRAPIRTWPDWVRHQRDELRLAECTAEAVGRRRGVRVRVLPAGGALAELMEAVDRGDADGLSWQELWAEDQVHLSELGNAYVAMVVFAAMYRMPTADLTVPGLSESRAAFFASLIDPYITRYYGGYEPPSVDECVDAMNAMCIRLGHTEGYCDAHESFNDETYPEP